MSLNNFASAWTPEDRAEFRKLYAAAVKAKQDIFQFQGNDVLVTYGKYLIEYWDGLKK